MSDGCTAGNVLEGEGQDCRLTTEGVDLGLHQRCSTHLPQHKSPALGLGMLPTVTPTSTRVKLAKCHPRVDVKVILSPHFLLSALRRSTEPRASSQLAWLSRLAILTLPLRAGKSSAFEIAFYNHCTLRTIVTSNLCLETAIPSSPVRQVCRLRTMTTTPDVSSAQSSNGSVRLPSSSSLQDVRRRRMASNTVLQIH